MAYSDQGGADIQNYLLLSVEGVGLGIEGTKTGDERQKVNDVIIENNVQQVLWPTFTGTGATITVSETLMVRNHLLLFGAGSNSLLVLCCFRYPDWM